VPGPEDGAHRKEVGQLIPGVDQESGDRFVGIEIRGEAYWCGNGAAITRKATNDAA
jgi:hypothetical protein